jgi:acetyltransferase-like isoleucine patch superfamily enzyme
MVSRRNFYNRLVNWFIFQYYQVEFSKSITLNGIIKISSRGRVVLGNNVTINSSARANFVGLANYSALVCSKGATIIIDDGCQISNSLIFARRGITIGKSVFIGGGCQILDSDFHPLSSDERVAKANKGAAEEIRIHDNVFIGANSIILKGVEIHANSIVAAGSVVTKDIGPSEIWGGNPAKFIRKNE